jgi:hypothetical protein
MGTLKFGKLPKGCCLESDLITTPFSTKRLQLTVWLLLLLTPWLLLTKTQIILRMQSLSAEWKRPYYQGLHTWIWVEWVWRLYPNLSNFSVWLVTVKKGKTPQAITAIVIVVMIVTVITKWSSNPFFSSGLGTHHSCTIALNTWSPRSSRSIMEKKQEDGHSWHVAMHRVSDREKENRLGMILGCRDRVET